MEAVQKDQTRDDLETLYDHRFSGREDYRRKVWSVLVSDFFHSFIPSDGVVLDLGCGYGEFINQVKARSRYAMDLNPDARRYVEPEVSLFQQDCSMRWPLPDNALDLVFTSNFFEHLPDKPHLAETLREAHRCLRPGGQLVAVGPNIKYLPGAYWDFWDHHLPLTEVSLGEGLQAAGFQLQRVVPRFLPPTMAHGPRYPLLFLRVYLKCPLAWRLFGRQFLVVATK